jgi:hypothetical protein
MEISMELFPKTVDRTPYVPSIPLLDIYMKGYKSVDIGDTCTPMFIAELFTKGKL